MRIVRATETFSAELKEFMCAAVQRRRDDDGFGGSRGGKSRNAMDLDSDSGNRLVCVTGGVSYLGRAIVKRLLVHGYSVRFVVDCPEDKEKVSEMEADAETASFSNRITSVVSRLTEAESLIKAFDGCAGVFHTSAFVDPAGISGYSKSMAELEAKVSENVIEACTRTPSVRKCVFTSSLLACAWQNSSFNNLDHSVINEETWSDEQLCIDNKLWYALGKLKAEKAAWRIADSKGLKLATICPALITGPDFFNRNSTSTLAYLKDFVSKYLYCLWWGLRNLSSYGQNITTSVYLGETLFCITICIKGLILFTLLIGNMQSSLQSMSVRVEEWRVKRRDTEEWMRHRQLPPELQERVRRFVQYKWLATRGVDEESILHSLPTDLRREIQRHLCLALVRRVPFFSQMDDQLLDAICGCLVSSLSTAGTYIFREGDPVNEMLFVIRGQIESSTTNGGRSGFFNSTTLRPGDFCGEELLTWALMPNSTLNLPSSTRSVRALSEVEAFALSAEDLKFVAHQFKRLQSKKLQHAFRYYSHQWRAWGACFVQSAWRRYKRRKLAKELSLHESSGYYYTDETGYNGEDEETREYYYGSDDEDIEGGSMGNINNNQNLGATILASKFAANTRRGTNQKASSSSTGKKDGSSSSLKMPQLFKPDEPDFSIDKEDV